MFWIRNTSNKYPKAIKPWILTPSPSADDDDEGELEEDVQAEDLGFITLLDNALVDLDIIHVDSS
jgi:hypothetical protein